MEASNLKISENVQKQAFVKGLQTSEIVKTSIISGLKIKRKILDHKITFSSKRNKISTVVDFEKKRQDWQQFGVM